MTKENNMTWTTDKIKQLKKLWSKGKSTLEIGRELGISKNAVVGKVHRLELNNRPAAVKKAPVKKVKQPKATKSENVTLLDLKLNSCRWPINDPKDADFHFCGKQTVTGKPYCQEHCKIAYTSLKELTNQSKEAKKAEEQKVSATPAEAPVQKTKEEKSKKESAKAEVKTANKKTAKTVEKTAKTKAASAKSSKSAKEPAKKSATKKSVTGSKKATKKK